MEKHELMMDSHLYIVDFIWQHFPGHGWFTGVVESYDGKAKLYRVVYEDGDAEEADLTHVQQLVQRATAPNPSTVATHPSYVGRRVEKVRKRFPTAVSVLVTTH